MLVVKAVDLHRFRSGQVLMSGGLSFEGRGASPTQGWVPAVRVVEAADVLKGSRPSSWCKFGDAHVRAVIVVSP